MRFFLGLAGLGVVAAIGAGAAPAAAAEQATRSTACWSQADKQDLKGAARTAFHTKCMEGALAPSKPTTPKDSLAEQAITAPSGADRTVRSKQCSAEADRRKLPQSDRDGFRLACLASAAPVKAIGVRQQQPKPTPAKDSLGGLTATPAQGAGAATSAGAQMKPK